MLHYGHTTTYLTIYLLISTDVPINVYQLLPVGISKWQGFQSVSVSNTW